MSPIQVVNVVNETTTAQPTRATVLVLAPGARDERYDGRRGDLFDGAFVDIVRLLDVSAEKLTVLVPWTADLAALVVAAIADTAPSFDPEGDAGLERSRSGLVPYVLDGATDDAVPPAFWNASHLALGGREPLPLSRALARAAGPVFVVALGLPVGIDGVRDVLREHAPQQVYAFDELLDAEAITRGLDANFDRVRVLTPPRASRESDDEPEWQREWEAQLEPYVPFGLLLQQALDAYLGDDGIDRPTPERGPELA